MDTTDPPTASTSQTWKESEEEKELEGSRWVHVRKATFPLKITLIAFLCIDFLVTLTAIGVRAVDLSGNGTDCGVDMSILMTQVGLEIAEAGLSIISLALVVSRFGSRVSQRLAALVVLKVVCIFFSVGYLAYPQISTVVVALVALVIRIIELILVAWISYRISLHSETEKLLPEPTESHLNITSLKSTSAYLKAVDQWADLAVVRSHLRSQLSNGRALFFLLGILVFGILVVNCGVQFVVMITTQSTVLPDSIIQQLSSTPPPNYFGANKTARNKVLVVVLDGLRNDMLASNSVLNAFVADTAIAPDLAVLQMNAQLPSMSVPNWLTIITGARPESTGVLGNLLVPETSLDSVFHQARLRNMNRGLTGSPWFADIISSQLP